jgi:cell division protein FtsB
MKRKLSEISGEYNFHENKKIKSDTNELYQIISDQQLEIVKLSVENNDLKNQIIKLKSEYDSYRKKAQYDYCHYIT